ncbi:MAG: hypothetical protein HRU81_05600 [Gammaproteobacteria bacterium]|nr:MAG: hypothetical protein HRU81_05600 [Gammaproteobacteria bacterium]
MKADVTQERIRNVLMGVLLPLARTLLRCGVSYTEFARLSKRAFVEAASADYGVRNRPTNIARVAVMTGLSRKEVSRIRVELKKNSLSALTYRNIPAEVLHRWHTDTTYLDTNGYPKALAFAGPKSFVTLVKSVTGDIPARTIERELSRSGALRFVLGRKLLPAVREYVPDSASSKLIEGLQFGLRRLTETICFNADPQNIKSPHIQRIVHTGGIAASDVKLVKDSISAIVAGFGRQIDDYLTSFQWRSGRKQRKAGPYYHVGVGLYYFENEEKG